jgi:hypothetical protein
MDCACVAKEMVRFTMTDTVADLVASCRLVAVIATFAGLGTMLGAV